MMSALASKIVVVTGATGQVGWGIAHAALDTGATVVLPVRSEAARKKVERDFCKARTSIVTVDFADESSLASTTSLEEEFQGSLMPELKEILPDAYAARVKRVGIVNAWNAEFPGGGREVLPSIA
jgi:NAD(P)-dependent dehydrogenase (short-subunit alcohol dehydrogenase family)